MSRIHNIYAFAFVCARTSIISRCVRNRKEEYNFFLMRVAKEKRRGSILTSLASHGQSLMGLIGICMFVNWTITWVRFRQAKKPNFYLISKKITDKLIPIRFLSSNEQNWPWSCGGKRQFIPWILKPNFVRAIIFTVFSLFAFSIQFPRGFFSAPLLSISHFVPEVPICSIPFYNPVAIKNLV